MKNEFKKKEVWLNAYPIFLWLALEPIVGLIDSKIASVINLETLSAIGIGETIYFVFIWVFIFLAYGIEMHYCIESTRAEPPNGIGHMPI